MKRMQFNEIQVFQFECFYGLSKLSRPRRCWDWDLINDLNSNGLCTQLGNSSNVPSGRYMRGFKESPVIAIVNNKGGDCMDLGREL
jgi:hypothetical protein